MDKPTQYQIKVKGHLDTTWSDSFEGLMISNLENGETLISGSIQDQAALHGMINRISSLGLTLISVNAVPEEDYKNNRRYDNE